MVYEIMTFRVCQSIAVPFPILWSKPSALREQVVSRTHCDLHGPCARIHAVPAHKLVYYKTATTR